ncbi:MAG: hypothetical protein JSV62_01315 [Promethearchaeota archaeon]|nr:MAG: hypothetical protein JSV62_01315 [Candidatus Lokiarchaeota archaeon]
MKKYLPQRASSFKCLDGHIVKSKAELIIDNHLYRLGFEHIYENTIKIRGKPIKYDWYLPKFDIYIEYWGYFGKKYMKRKAEKLELYRKGKLKIISIEDIMLEDIYSYLENMVVKFIQSEIKIFKIKHCNNCGIALDDRF